MNSYFSKINFKKLKKFWIFCALSTAFVLMISCARPLIHLITTVSQDVNQLEPLPPGYVDDASRLNETQVSDVWDVPIDHDNPEAQIAQLLARARNEGLRVSIAGARHSMGGHTIYPGGIAINMLPWNEMELDENQNILNVQAGAIWKDIIAYLDKRGRSVSIMQSNNSFSVGGSISVNCHGWQYGRPPIASTVKSFRLMLADGSILRCSRDQNAELFSLVLGGYGLFGIILDVELRVVPNERLRVEPYIVPAGQALELFDSEIKDRTNLQMLYGRMNIDPETMFEEVIINAFFSDHTGEIPSLTDLDAPKLRRAIFRGSAKSDYGKELRWYAETHAQPLLKNKVFSRNQLLNESVEVFGNRSSSSTDILHEYFIPRKHVEEFVQALRKIVANHNANLLNVTIRYVEEDKDTFLRYADQPMMAFVLLFVQDRNDEAEKEMEALTRELIDAALESEGRYYLPYRMHATIDQFQSAYPMSTVFFKKKLQYDPDELFQNQFYIKYGKVNVEIEGSQEVRVQL